MLAIIEENPWTFLLTIALGLMVGGWLVRRSLRPNGKR